MVEVKFYDFNWEIEIFKYFLIMFICEELFYYMLDLENGLCSNCWVFLR